VARRPLGGKFWKKKRVDEETTTGRSLGVAKKPKPKKKGRESGRLVKCSDPTTTGWNDPKRVQRYTYTTGLRTRWGRGGVLRGETEITP